MCASRQPRVNTDAFCIVLDDPKMPCDELKMLLDDLKVLRDDLKDDLKMPREDL